MQYSETSKNAVLQESFCSFMFTSVARPGGDVDQDAHLAEHKIQLAGHSILPSCPSFSLFLVFFIKVKLRSMHLGDMRGRLIGSSFP